MRKAFSVVPVRLKFFGGFQLVQPLEKEQVRNLFNDFERIRNSASPEGISDGVDLVADVAS